MGKVYQNVLSGCKGPFCGMGKQNIKDILKIFFMNSAL